MSVIARLSSRCSLFALHAALAARRLVAPFLTVLALAVAPAGAGLAQAIDQSNPEALVRAVSQDVLTTIKADKDLRSGNIVKINALVETRILPYVDFSRMTASAVGRHWNAASTEQKQKITAEFRQLLVFTYAGALSEVRDQTIRFRPTRIAPEDTEAEVRSQVVQPRGGDPMQLDYRLVKEGAVWKIVDLNVLGIWLVETYRASFNAEVNKGGIDGLIKTLVDKNATLARAAGKGKA